VFAIAFDIVVAETAAKHPKGVAQAYADSGGTLNGFGFNRVQGSLYLTERDDLANLFAAIMALRALPWFAPSVRDIRAFKVEHWSDFTQLVKGNLPAGTAQ
jgi:virulence-associated protein VapD